MIKLCVEEYCQECAGFEPCAVVNRVLGEDGEDVTITQVCCSRRELCANVAKRYRRQTANEHGTEVIARVC